MGFILSPITYISPASTTRDGVQTAAFIAFSLFTGAKLIVFLKLFIYSGVVPQQPPRPFTPRYANSS